MQEGLHWDIRLNAKATILRKANPPKLRGQNRTTSARPLPNYKVIKIIWVIVRMGKGLNVRAQAWSQINPPKLRGRRVQATACPLPIWNVVKFIWVIVQMGKGLLFISSSIGYWRHYFYHLSKGTNDFDPATPAFAKASFQTWFFLKRHLQFQW